jgi:hypothetical protein
VSDISITALEEGAFGVEVVEGQRNTHHRVTVPPSLLEDLGLQGVEPQDVVRESFEFLLEREPPTSILNEFSLDVIGRYFPEYSDELPRRLGR